MMGKPKDSHQGIGRPMALAVGADPRGESDPEVAVMTGTVLLNKEKIQGAGRLVRFTGWEMPMVRSRLAKFPQGYSEVGRVACEPAAACNAGVDLAESVA
eukprot:810013-Amphidinium_carterae.2